MTSINGLWPAKLDASMLPNLFQREMRKRWFLRKLRYTDPPPHAIPLLGPTDGQCLVWTGPRESKMPYGKVEISGRMFLAHRVSYALHYGIDPADLKVCHKCDNPPCCSPRHLFLGTTLDNNLDMIAKGRNNPPRGERSGTSQLTEVEVLAMRALRQHGLSYQAIADQYSVSRTAARYAIQGVTWAHLTNVADDALPGSKGSARP
jgi:hypothetical protein